MIEPLHLDGATRGIMIDSPTTTDRDDAIWVTQTDTGFETWTHIAAVPEKVPQDSPIDRDAKQRGMSRYLPDHTIGMLPPEVEQDATLIANETRPSTVVQLSLTRTGELTDINIAPGELVNGEAMTYEEAAFIQRDVTHHLHQPLNDAHRLAELLLRRRRNQGALAFYDLFEGYATNEEGQLVKLEGDQHNSGYLIISELMIATNSAIAMWAAQADIPLLYRNHRMAAVAGDSADLVNEYFTAEAIGDSTAYETLRQQLSVIERPATYDPHIRGHHGLSLAAYAHCTSPLRRYPDLVNQRILRAIATNKPHPYTMDELIKLSKDINQTIDIWRRERHITYQQHAKQQTRENLRAADYEALSTTDFSKVLRLALAARDLPTSLKEVVTDRIHDDKLPLRDQCEILTKAKGNKWRAIAETVLNRIAEIPSEALTIISMYAQAKLGKSINESNLEWNVQSRGSAQEPCFEAQLTLCLPDTIRTSRPRLHGSKKEAKAQAALALLSDIAELPDVSENMRVPTKPVNESATTLVPSSRNDIASINEYTQQGVIMGVSWEFDASGPAHQPEFTCTVTAVSADGDPLEATGDGKNKQQAKTAAASGLRRLIETDAAKELEN